ncbi:hypothetical protein ACFBZI_11085 [Moraxella sp. ZJ142]|uniref:hypothetical protein n=1 Tax=Moraxella marmotae TaxID=3344520 RepID=UPI0035D4BA7B
MTNIKVGDKVYFPAGTTKICTVERSGNATYPLVIRYRNFSEYFLEDGCETETRLYPALLPATRRNCELLSELYGVEFEKPDGDSEPVEKQPVKRRGRPRKNTTIVVGEPVQRAGTENTAPSKTPPLNLGELVEHLESLQLEADELNKRIIKNQIKRKGAALCYVRVTDTDPPTSETRWIRKVTKKGFVSGRKQNKEVWKHAELVPHDDK